MDTKNADHQFEKFKLAKGPVLFEELASLYNTLEPITTADIIGEWKGGFIKSGRILDWTLKSYWILKWVGKNFVTENNVKALLYRFLGIKFNFPIIGKARVRQIAFMGKVSTAMIYNHLPIIDHFRKINDSTLMGAMDYKGKVVLYFYLYR